MASRLVSALLAGKLEHVVRQILLCGKFVAEPSTRHFPLLSSLLQVSKLQRIYVFYEL